VQGIDLPYSGVTLSYPGGLPENSSTVILQRYNAIENPNGNLPRVTQSDPNKNKIFSDIWLSDASYFKISNINLSYRLPESITNKIKVKDLMIYCSVQNLYTFTKWLGGDPDATFISDYNGGNPADKIPQPRTWILGLKLSF